MCGFPSLPYFESKLVFLVFLSVHHFGDNSSNPHKKLQAMKCLRISDFYDLAWHHGNSGEKSILQIHEFTIYILQAEQSSSA